MSQQLWTDADQMRMENARLSERCRRLDAEVKDLKARLKAARELHWAISLVEREAFDALLRATNLRVKRWKP